MYSYVSDLCADLRKDWRQPVSSAEEQFPELIPPLPSDDKLVPLLETAYHASLKTEEGRPVTFRIIYGGKSDVEQIISSEYIREFDSPPYFVEFGSTYPYLPGEIRRLAPAVRPINSMIGVEAAHCSGASSSALRIWGLVDMGKTWVELLHRRTEFGVGSLRFLTVESTEPGHLLISRSGSRIISLRSGHIVRPRTSVLTEGPVSVFFEDSIADLEAAVLAEVGGQTAIGKVPNAQPAYRRTLRRLLLQIDDRSHGGTVIVVPDDMQHDDARLGDAVAMKYVIDYTHLWELLKERLINERVFWSTHTAITDQDSPVSLKDYRNAIDLKDRLDRINLHIEDSIDFIATLANVDGAVVLTDRFRILGFGAEITANPSTLIPIKIAETPDGTETHSIDLEAYGTRHRSAFRWCSSYENSLVFVVSSDGGIKAIKRHGPQVLVWPDIGPYHGWS